MSRNLHLFAFIAILQNAVLLFPGPEAKSLEEIYQNSVSSLKRSNVDHTGDVPSKRPRVQSKHQSSLDNLTEESSKPRWVAFLQFCNTDHLFYFA